MTPNDEKQLDLLGTLHYVAAALAAPIALLGAAESAMGIAILFGKIDMGPTTADRAFGLMPMGLGLVIILFGVAFVCTNVLTARSLRSRTRYTLCVVTAAANCMHFPLGTLLGGFTIAVLTRPGIQTAFEETKRGRAARDREPSGPPPHLQAESLPPIPREGAP